MLWLTRRNVFAGVVIFALGLSFGVSVLSPVRLVNSQNTVDAETELLHSIYNRVNKSVVSIQVRIPAQALPNTPDNSNQGGQNFQYAAGSGWMYDTAGHIITNAHVIDQTDRVEVTFSDDIIMRAKVIGEDIDSDIAVLKVDGNVSAYPPLTVANSDAIVVGDRAIAIGNPFERAGTMTHGIVSGVHRAVTGLRRPTSSGNYTIPDAVQTDAALNPGNSGGPLLNGSGEVIGVNEQIASDVRQSSGVSFAIPSNLTKIVADVLIQNGKIVHTYMGITGTSLDLDYNDALNLPENTRGAYVLDLAAGGPADQAGIKAGTRTVSIDGVDVPVGGDVIVAIDKTPVHHFDDITSYLFTHTTVGQTITVTVLRDGKQQDIPVKLTARPQANQ